MPSSKKTLEAKEANSKLVPYWKSDCGRAVVYLGDNLKVMSAMDPEQFHAVVTDPPYGLEFMGKDWDAPWKNNGAVIKDPATERGGFQDGNGGNPYSRSRIEYGRGDNSSVMFQLWFLDRADALLRVTKPGAHLLSFGGTRMWHRMACAVEDAGWEIRDTIMWCYGCLSEDTEILTSHGWDTYSNIGVGEIVAAWDSHSESIVLEEVEHMTLAPYNGQMIKFENDNTDQLLTPNHRVYGKHAQRFQACGVRHKWYDENWSVKEAGDINRHQGIKLPLAGYHNGPGIGGDDYAELLGWVFTEGGFDINGTGVRITQFSVNQDKVEIIDACVVANGIDAKHYTRERKYKDRTYTEHTWFFTGENAVKVRESLPGKHPTWGLLWEMTLSEKRAFFNAAMLGDGSGMAFFQKDDADREWFQALVHCMGMQGRDNQKKYCVSLHDNDTTELQHRHLQKRHEEYNGIVWCVTVKSGAFLARRNGKIFITGNSGFPKSMDVSKAIDKMLGARREVIDTVNHGGLGGQFKSRDGVDGGYGYGENWDITRPVTDAAKQWDGWGTCLKPALEPIVMARKPFTNSVAQNVLEHGCGGINVDGCRVGTTGQDVTRQIQSKSSSGSGVYQFNSGEAGSESMKGGFSVTHKDGRWPANLVHDGSDEVVDLFPDGAKPKQERAGLRGGSSWHGKETIGSPDGVGRWPADEGGSAARFFYSAKASDADRSQTDDTVHPTVKPLDLMRYLVRLVCPRGGTVLDPFMGSGSTGCAAIAEGMYFVGIEQSKDYADLAVDRLKEMLGVHPTVERLETGKRAVKDVPPPPKRMR